MFFYRKYQQTLRKLGLVKKRPVSPRRKNTVYLKHKPQARAIITQRVVDLNMGYGFDYNRIAIRNQRTRWGSCSTKRNLNFNYKLIFLPPRVRDYVIVHELCHLEEFNHSKRFWELVAKGMPDYLQLRKSLRSVEGLPNTVATAVAFSDDPEISL